jgi:HK97 family phage portal protein
MSQWLTQFDAMPGAASAIDVQAAAFPSDDWFFDSVGHGRSDAGVVVSPNTALGHGPVWQAVNILAGDVGQLPFRKMRRERVGSGDTQRWATEKDDGHWADFLLRDAPNELMTPSQFKETMMAWALLWGNAIAYIDKRGTPDAQLLPLRPDRVHHYDLGRGKHEIVYHDETQGRPVSLMPREIFHIRGLCTDGFWGLSAVQTAKNVIGHGLALQAHGDAVFKNSARPSGYLRKPEGSMSPEARANLRREWESIHSGAHNAGRIAVLWEGMEFHQMSMSNEDAQWLEGRKLDREFIASLFNLPAFKLNALENSAVRANLEEQNRDYFNTSLARWTNKFAEEASRKLLTFNERRSNQHFFKWFPESFLRGDTQTRFESYSTAIASRWMSPNEVREREDLNPYEGGDSYENPNTTSPGSQPAPEPEPAEQPATDTAEAATALVEDRARQLLKAEANRVKQAAKKVGNFVEWLDRYYDGLEDVAEEFFAHAVALAAACGHGGDWRRAIREHAQAAKGAWLALTDMVTQEELHGAVTETAEHWPDKAARLTQRILSHE